MQVAELSAFHQFRLTESVDPAHPAPGEIQVAVSAVGICGSDVHYFSEGAIGDTPCVYPMVLGHEPAGHVRKIGAGVTGWSVGDHAVLEPALYCYHCEFCLSGHHNVCANIKFLSTPEEPGFFRQFVNLPAHNLLPLPRNLSGAQGTLVEPLAVVLHSLALASPRPGETAVVFGAGPIGLLTIAALKVSGAQRIWAVEPIQQRREMALRLGADEASPPAEIVRSLLAGTGKRGVDLAFDCVAKGNSLNDCVQVTRNAGRVVLTGIPSEARVPLDVHVMRRKELTLYNVMRSNHESSAALELLAEKPDLFSPILTHQRPLSSIQPAFEMLESYTAGAMKVTINCNS